MHNERMTIFLSGVDSADFHAIRELLEERLPKSVELEMDIKTGFNYDNKIPPEMRERWLDFIELSRADYEAMGREYGDITDLTYGDLDRIGKLPGIGGGGMVAELVLWFASAAPSVQAAGIAMVGVVLREIIRGSFGHASTISVQRGEDKVEVSGLPREEAEEIIEKFFAEIRKDKLL